MVSNKEVSLNNEVQRLRSENESLRREISNKRVVNYELLLDNKRISVLEARIRVLESETAELDAENDQQSFVIFDLCNEKRENEHKIEQLKKELASTDEQLTQAEDRVIYLGSLQAF